MNKRACLFLAVLTVLAALISATNVSLFLKRLAEETPEVQYELCLGLNDKDANAPLLSLDDARAKLEAILLDRFGGFTIQEGRGGWIDEKGTVFREDVLVVYLDGTTLEEARALADLLLREFNQSSILIRAVRVQTEFYTGERTPAPSPSL